MSNGRELPMLLTRMLPVSSGARRTTGLNLHSLRSLFQLTGTADRDRNLLQNDINHLAIEMASHP